MLIILSLAQQVLATMVLLVLPATQVLMVPLVNRVHVAPQENQVHQAPQVTQAYRAYLDPPDHPDPEAYEDNRECQECQVYPVKVSLYQRYGKSASNCCETAWRS